MIRPLLPRKLQMMDAINPSTSNVSPSSNSPSGQPRLGGMVLSQRASPERSLRQRSVSISAIALQQSSPSLHVRRRDEDESLSNSDDDEAKGDDRNNGRVGFRSALRPPPFLMGPHCFSEADLHPLSEGGDIDPLNSPNKASLPYHRSATQSTLMMDSPSGSTVGASLSDVDLESGDLTSVAPIVLPSPIKKVQAYQRNYAFILRSRENIIIHLLMEMKMLRTDLVFILFVTFYQFFHSSVTNLAYWQHAQLTAANRVPLRDLAFDLLPPLDGDLWIVSEYILYGILTIAISCIVTNLVVKWNAPHGRPIYCVQILRRLGMTWIVCQTLRMISFLVTTLPGASRQCRYAVPEGLTTVEMMHMPAPNEGNPPGWAPPTDLYDLIFRVDASNGCGDLMFSSHTIYTMSFVCVVFKYFNFKWLKWIMALGQIVIVPFILAARKHYSVDVFTALYVTPLVFEMLWSRFPDRDTSADMAMHYGIRFYLAQVNANSFGYVVSVWGKEYQVDHDQLPFDISYGHNTKDAPMHWEKGRESTRSLASIV